MERCLGKQVPEAVRKAWADHLAGGSRVAVVVRGPMLLALSVRPAKAEYRVSGLLFDYFPERSRGYRVGDRWFPAADISSADLAAALGSFWAASETLRVDECDLPTHASQGYRGILLAGGRIAGHG